MPSELFIWLSLLKTFSYLTMTCRIKSRIIIVVLHAQSYPTLCYPMDCRPPGSTVHGIFQARILEWVDISYTSGSSQPRDRVCVFCVSCIVKQILYHYATCKPPELSLYHKKSSSAKLLIRLFCHPSAHTQTPLNSLYYFVCRYWLVHVFASAREHGPYHLYK